MEARGLEDSYSLVESSTCCLDWLDGCRKDSANVPIVSEAIYLERVRTTHSIHSPQKNGILSLP